MVRSRRRLGLCGALVATVAVSLSSRLLAWVSTVPSSQEQKQDTDGGLPRSDLRRLLLPVASAGLPLVLGDQASAEGETRRMIQLGDVYTVEINGPALGIDFGGGKGDTRFGEQFGVRIKAVEPGGPASKAGLRIGDEVLMVEKFAQNGPMLLGDLMRKDPDPNNTIQTFLAQETRTLPIGGALSLRYTGTLQPGEKAPDFDLFSSLGKNVTLTELLKPGRRLVLFFRPGARYSAGDTGEIKAFRRTAAIFDKLGADLASITYDIPGLLAKQAKAAKAQFPLMADLTYEVAKRYGSTMELQAVGTVIDRKTYVIGSDGRIEAVFPAVGFQPDFSTICQHVGEVAAYLGGDQRETFLTAFQKPESIGSFLDRVTKSLDKAQAELAGGSGSKEDS